MINLVDYIDKLASDYNIKDTEFKLNLSAFLVKNKWFGIKITLESGNILVDESQLKKKSVLIDEFCRNYNKSSIDKFDILFNDFAKQFPDTAKYFQKYSTSAKLNTEVSYYILDFMLTNLVGELYNSNDREIEDLLNIAHTVLSKMYCDLMADYINWLRNKRKTVYRNIYYVNSYSDRAKNSEAYQPNEYLKILYYLFNHDYIVDNNMYVEAAQSKNYVDTWLFLSLHFLCALRNTDLIRIPHPRLVSSPADTLNQVASGTFSAADAKIVLNSVVWHLDAIMLRPNKTSRISGISTVKFHVPTTLEAHIGTLFAIAEAHFRLKSLDSEEPLIRIITSYEAINRYMGNDIGDLFLEADFRSRAANKSYLQMVELLSDDILGVTEDFHVKGYILAALARSHKGSYGDFAKTTSIYIKDAKMSGYTADIVARELFERGVLSCNSSMLLKMITNGEYQKLSVENQTKLIKKLNMSPLDIEQSVATMKNNLNRSVAVVDNIYKNLSKEKILTILHRIGSNQAASKCDGCLCIITAQGKLCPYPDNANCIACEYEISTKTTLYLMVQEYHRLNKLYKTTTNDIEKARYKYMAQTVIIPAINDMLAEVEAQYGSEGLESLEYILSQGRL